jgi:hypothetical protein
MDISRSIDGGYVAGALIFSGRPDPVWPLAATVATALQALWDSMAPTNGQAPSAPPLGYRGCFMRAPSGSRWFAYRGVVSLRTGDETSQRKDEGRQFEREILKTAPAGAIPSQFLATEFE